MTTKLTITTKTINQAPRLICNLDRGDIYLKDNVHYIVVDKMPYVFCRISKNGQYPIIIYDFLNRRMWHTSLDTEYDFVYPKVELKVE